ncbi:MAG: type 2 isopentenyl-diphosphate Delta-isomerase [Candidatus Bathyarchaeia archaeon]
MERRLSRKSQARQTEERKNDHISICLEENVYAKKITTGFEDVFLIHRALPEINKNDVDASTHFFNHAFTAPLIVTGMTGGTEKSLRINAAIAEAVEELGIGMGVGSQRAALENPKMERTFSVVRKKAPNAFVLANIGAPQIRKENCLSQVKRAIKMVDADALAVHLNPLQEAVQPEGETDYSEVLKNIGELTHNLDVPVIVKETGAGISAIDARKLVEVGVSGIDVAGAGGTSWAAVEYYRAKKCGDAFGEELGRSLWDWGIPTVVALVEVVQSVNVPIIASGGVRTGCDVAKSIALGASLAGFAAPVLSPSMKDSRFVRERLEHIVQQLKTVMFLVGASSIGKLKNVPVVVTGRTAEWLQARGFDINSYATRGG